MSNKFRCLTVLFALAIASGMSPGFSQEDEKNDEVKNIDTAISKVAEEVFNYLNAKGQDRIKLTPFQTAEDSTAGRELTRRLKKRLQQDIEIVNRGAQWRLIPKFFVKVDKGQGKVFMSIEVEVLGAGDAKQFSITDDVEMTLEEFVRFKQPPGVDVGPVSEPAAGQDPGEVLKEVPKARRKKTIDNSVKPSFHLVSTSAMSAEKGSKFQIELLRHDPESDKFKPVAIRNEEGFAVADLQDGDIFEVKIYNLTNHDVGVELTVDGINTFEFSEDKRFKDLGMWIVERQTTGIIKGWYIKGPNRDEFEVTSGDDSDVLDLPPALNEGAITATFFHAWKPGEAKPAVEEIAELERKGSRVKRGKRIKSFGGVEKRFFGTEFLATLTVRYDLPENLPPGEEAEEETAKLTGN